MEKKIVKPVAKASDAVKPVIAKRAVVKPVIVKPIVAKPLKEQLLDAVNKVLDHNKIEMTPKMQKAVKKSNKRIVKLRDRQIENAY